MEDTNSLEQRYVKIFVPNVNTGFKTGLVIEKFLAGNCLFLEKIKSKKRKRQ